MARIGGPAQDVYITGGQVTTSSGSSTITSIPARVNQLGNQRLTMAGAAQSATVTSGTDIVRIAAEGAAIRWRFGGTATSTDGGYLPQNTVEWIEIPDGETLSVYGETGAFANLVYGEFV